MSEITVIDASGLLCPLPVLRLRKVLLPMSEGACVKLLATDPASQIDVPHFCNEAAHVMVEMRETGGAFEFTVQRGPVAPSAEDGLTPRIFE